MGVIEKITDDGCSFDDWQTITDGRILLVSISGGKDSTAMILWMIENGLHDRCQYVYADTKWEHPELYRYIDDVIQPLVGDKLVRVTSTRYPGGMADLVVSRAAFPSGGRKFCTQELKQFPIRDHIKKLRADGHDPINVVGVRAAESQARSKLEMWDRGGPMGKDLDIWRPLIHWTVQDVVDIHARHGVSPCPLYLKKENAAKRVGCWPCIRSRKSEIAAVAQTTPWRIDQIRQLEADVLAQKIAKKGDEWDPNIPGAVPTFFQPLETKERAANGRQLAPPRPQHRHNRVKVRRRHRKPPARLRRM
jgi:3'-phosphoadenosine 5'-phosphosulfate sulfotransferase (PAPS reductase)/FAD synthetase